MSRKILIACLLALATVVVYWPLSQAEFLNFDDPIYVTNNADVLRGMTWQGFLWAFDGAHACFWHPLTWLSHMLDCQLFGRNAAAHHLSALSLHAVNSLLLLFVLQRMTKAFWRSAMVAALFALHPLHVESVAWISERKDLLSTFFFFLTLGAYTHYANPRSAGDSRSYLWYGASLLLFIFSLMAKPMLVTLPFLLLLLDYWPLRRLFAPKNSGAAHMGKLVLEKLPFLAFSIAASVITMFAEASGGAIADVQQVPISARLNNAVISYGAYLGKTFVPENLIVTYPLQSTWPLWQIVVAGCVLAGVSLLAFIWVKQRPYFFVGWFWYVGTLVPVIGLIQVGAHSMADRYTYVTLIGFFVAVVWLASDWLAQQRQGHAVAIVAGSAILIACAAVTRQQVQFWRNSETLFRHALRVSPENFLAYHHLGLSYVTAGNFPDGIANLNDAIRFGPAYPPAWFTRGTAYALTGNLDAAEKDFRETLRLKPESYQAYFQLGKVYALRGKLDDAKSNFLQAIKLKPDYGEALMLLGNVCQMQGAPAEALPYLEAAVKAEPENGEGRYYLANVLIARGNFAEAKKHLEAAVQYQPDFPPSYNDLALMSVTRTEPDLHDIPKGVAWAEQACKLTANQNPAFLQTLVIAYAAAGRAREAAATAEQALSLATAAGNAELADQLRQQLAELQAGPSHKNARP